MAVISYKKGSRLGFWGMLIMVSLSILSAQCSDAQQPWLIPTVTEAQYHSNTAIHLIEWNPQGDVLAIATSDGLLLLETTLQPVIALYSGDLIRAFSWNPTGHQLVLTHDQQLEIWDWDNTARTLTFERSISSTDTPYAVAWSPNGRQIVSLNLHQDQTYYDWIGTFNVWSTITWTLEHNIGGGTPRYVFQPLEASVEGGVPTVQRFVWATNGTPVIAAVGALNPIQDGLVPGEPISVYLLNVETGTEVGIFPLITNEFGNAIAWQPGGDLVAVADSYGAVLYHTEDGQSVGSLVNGSETFAISWDPSGNYALVGTLLFRVMPEQRLGEFGSIWGAKVVDWHPSGAFLTIATADNTISNRNPMILSGYTPEPSIPTLIPLPTGTTTPTATPNPVLATYGSATQDANVILRQATSYTTDRSTGGTASASGSITRRGPEQPSSAQTVTPPDAISSQANSPAQAIMFVSDRDGQRSAYVMQADGSNVHRYIDSSFEVGGQLEEVNLSPDGHLIAFTSGKNRSDYAYYAVFLLDTSTGNVSAVSDTPQSDSAYPRWSPDGSQLAYLADGMFKSYDRLMIMDTTTRQSRVVIDSTALLYAINLPVSITGFDWSPDGQQLVMSVQTGQPNVTGFLVVINVDGTNPHRVTPNDITASYPSWQWQQDLVYYNCPVNFHSEICSFNLQTAESESISQVQNALLNDPDDHAAFIWFQGSADGLFAFQFGSNPDIYVFNPQTGSVNNITAGSEANNWAPYWITLVPTTPTPIVVNSSASGSPSDLLSMSTLPPRRQS